VAGDHGVPSYRDFRLDRPSRKEWIADALCRARQ
jgi:hypothetical protein